jgi:hypothetical protein
MPEAQNAAMDLGGRAGAAKTRFVFGRFVDPEGVVVPLDVGDGSVVWRAIGEPEADLSRTWLSWRTSSAAARRACGGALPR